MLVWRVFPYAQDCLCLHLNLFCIQYPLHLALLGPLLALAFELPDSATYSLVQFNLPNKSRLDHPPSDDHNDCFTGGIMGQVFCDERLYHQTPKSDMRFGSVVTLKLVRVCACPLVLSQGSVCALSSGCSPPAVETAPFESGMKKTGSLGTGYHHLHPSVHVIRKQFKKNQTTAEGLVLV